MLKHVLPEEVGGRSEDVHAPVSSLVKRKIHMHSLLLMRGDSRLCGLTDSLSLCAVSAAWLGEIVAKREDVTP